MNFAATEASKKTGFLESKGQTPIFYRHYPVENQRAFICLVHGFGEHSGRYIHVIDSLRNQGYEVFAVDLRGHGHSKGNRGDVESFYLYEEDVLSALKHMEKHFLRDRKLFLLGHSMGALICLRIMKKSRVPLSGLVLSSPLFGLKLPIPSWKLYSSLVAARLVPELRVESTIKGRHLSSDECVVKSYDHDPLVLKNLSVRAFREIYYGWQNALDLAHDIPSSLFLQVAGNDPVVDAKKSELWFSHIDKKQVDARIKVYAGFLHEIYNEARRKEPVDDCINWLLERT
jgi:alpha-beta hydrolase superfamily lysophospholipase